MSQAGYVFAYGMVTAVATALGVLPFAFVKQISPRVVSVWWPRVPS